LEGSLSLKNHQVTHRNENFKMDHAPSGDRTNEHISSKSMEEKTIFWHWPYVCQVLLNDFERFCQTRLYLRVLQPMSWGIWPHFCQFN